MSDKDLLRNLEKRRRGSDRNVTEKKEEMMLIKENLDVSSSRGFIPISENSVFEQDGSSDMRVAIVSDVDISEDTRPVKKKGRISLPEFVDKILEGENATNVVKKTSKFNDILMMSRGKDVINEQFTIKNLTKENLTQVEGIDSLMNKTIKVETASDNPVMAKDSIILKSLERKNKTTPSQNMSKLSPFTKKIKMKSAKDVKEVIETTPDPEADYLDYSLYADYYNNPMEDSDGDGEDFLEVVKFRDYPMEDGYVRIPVFFQGLEVREVAEVPHLWDAKESFVEQVGSKLYMFIPSAILGFIIGLLFWVVCLLILRTFGVFKKAVIRVFKKEKVDDMDLAVKYVISGDPWIKISDAEKIHSVNGSIRKSVLGPYSPEKMAEFNQEVLQTINYLNTPDKGVEGMRESEDSFAGQGRQSWRVKGRLRRSSN